MITEENNPFRQFDTAFEPSESLKEEIMGSIDHLHLLADILDLFSGQMGKTMGHMFKTNVNRNSSLPDQEN